MASVAGSRAIFSMDIDDVAATRRIFSLDIDDVVATRWIFGLDIDGVAATWPISDLDILCVAANWLKDRPIFARVLAASRWQGLRNGLGVRNGPGEFA